MSDGAPPVDEEMFVRDEAQHLFPKSGGHHKASPGEEEAVSESQFTTMALAHAGRKVILSRPPLFAV